MKHRIAADVIVENEGRVLLVCHCKPGIYDFWVAPGGGAEGTEDLRATATREVFEESGLNVEPLQIAYIMVEAAWLSRGEFTGRTVFPPVLQAEYWQDKERSFAFPRYLGLREMTFY